MHEGILSFVIYTKASEMACVERGDTAAFLLNRYFHEGLLPVAVYSKGSDMACVVVRADTATFLLNAIDGEVRSFNGPDLMQRSLPRALCCP